METKAHELKYHQYESGKLNGSSSNVIQTSCKKSTKRFEKQDKITVYYSI